MERIQELNENYEYFESILDSLIPEHSGEYAIIRHQEIIAFCKSITEAHKYATQHYSDGVFSIQKVANEPVELGFFSHADDCR